jgi:hypothetical protein
MPIRRSAFGKFGSGLISNDLIITFGATENPISQGGKWKNGQTDGVLWQDVQTVPGFAEATGFAGDRFEGSAFDDNIAQATTALWSAPPDMFIEGVVHYGYSGLPNAAHEIELLARFSISASDAHGYEILWGVDPTGSYTAAVRWAGGLGAFNAIFDPGDGSMPTPTENDVLRAEFTGSTCRLLLHNSVISGAAALDLSKEVGGSTLGVWSSGQPGVGFWPVHGTGQDITKFCWKQIRCGAL